MSEASSAIVTSSVEANDTVTELLQEPAPFSDASPSCRSNRTGKAPSTTTQNSPESESKKGLSNKAPQSQKGKSDAKIKIKTEPVPSYTSNLSDLEQRAANSARHDARESKLMTRFRRLPFFHLGSRRCWEKSLDSCKPQVVYEEIAHGQRVRPTPISVDGLKAFADVASADHPWRQIFRLLPDSMIFVDDSILKISPPPDKGKRAKKPSTPLEVLSRECCKYRGVKRVDVFIALWERNHWIVESSVLMALAETWIDSDLSDKVDEELAALLVALRVYVHERKQCSDLLRQSQSCLGDAVEQCVTRKIDGTSAPSMDTEVVFDPAIATCSLVNLSCFPETDDRIAEVDEIDSKEPWRIWWLTKPGLHPYNTIFRQSYPEFPLFVPHGADPAIVEATVMLEQQIYEPSPPKQHPNTGDVLNRPAKETISPGERARLG